MADNDLKGPVLGVAWDGTGYGGDGTVWGGEFFVTDGGDWTRFAALRPFPLPGSDQAVKECRRSALGLLFTLFGRAALTRRDIAPVRAFNEAELKTIATMLERGVNAPVTTSTGRLFDAVCSLAGIRQVNVFEGQGAMELEFSIPRAGGDRAYRIDIRPVDRAGTDALTGPTVPRFQLDWSTLVTGLLDDLREGDPTGEISLKFHNGLVESIVDIARLAGHSRVVLSGGCFQNRYLTERTVTRLREEDFQPYWHQRVPPNDGGIALGQLYAARAAHHQMEEARNVPGDSRKSSLP
jgi:hydrogenase maturation protein HypF